MQANLKPTVTIEEENRGCYHVMATKVIPNPKDPAHPQSRPRLLIFRPVDYRKYFMCSDRENIEYLKTMNYEGAVLVHDPTLEETRVVEFPKSAELEYREAKQTALSSAMTRKGRVRK
jgi:hypothetical protein